MASGSYNSSQSNGKTLSIPASAYNISVTVKGASGGPGGSDDNGSGGGGGNGRSGTFSLPDFTAIKLASYSGEQGGPGGSCFGSAGSAGSSSVASGGSGGEKGGCSGSGGGGGGASGVYSVTHSAWIIVAGGGGGGGGGSWNRNATGGSNAGGFSAGGNPGTQSGSDGDGPACNLGFLGIVSGDGGAGGGGGGGTTGGGAGSGGCDNQSGGTGGGGGGSGYNSSRATLISQGDNSGSGSVSVSYQFKIAEIQYFRAIPNPRSDGTYDVDLEWDIDDAESASIDQGVGSITLDGNGNSESSTTVSTGLSPSNEILTKTYTLTVNGLDGSSITQSITVAMVDGSVSVSNTSFYSSGAISFSSLRTNFKETSSGPISASELFRNTKTSEVNPIVPNSTENANITSYDYPDGYSSIDKTALSDLSIEDFRNSIKYYNLTQTGGSIDLNISSQNWNSNLDKNISKTFFITGDCDSSSSYYYVTTSPQAGLVETYSNPGSYTFNLPQSINIKIKIAGAAGGSGGFDACNAPGAPNVDGGTGGNGRYAEFTLPNFTSGTLTLVVGGPGGNGKNTGQTAFAGGSGGSNGGGTGGNDRPGGSSGGGGGGGGYSYISLDDTVLAVAGGGGGGGGASLCNYSGPNSSGYSYDGGDGETFSSTNSSFSASSGGNGDGGASAGGDGGGVGGGGGGASGGNGGLVAGNDQSGGAAPANRADGGLGGGSKYRSDILTLESQSVYTASTNGFIEIEYDELPDPHKPAVKFSNSISYNLNIDVQGSIKGSDGISNIITSDNATSRTGSKLAVSNPNGGDAMQIDTDTGSITINVDAGAEIIKGSKFSGSYSDGAAITGTNYTVTGTINGTTIQGSYQAS